MIHGAENEISYLVFVVETLKYFTRPVGPDPFGSCRKSRHSRGSTS
jgi:hypothetical protein